MFRIPFTATHEKGFILYLGASHMSFLLIIKINHELWSYLNAEQKFSVYKKVAIFVFSFVSLALMAYFYYRHIVHCDNLGNS